MSHLGAIFMTLLFCLSFAVADTSLYIPGFDEQPISVTAVGVGPDGRTTWRIQPGRPTGTIPAAPFPITATMLQGPSDAVVYASLPQLEISLSCAINSGIANCIGEVDENDMTATTSIHESAKPFLVQGGGSGGSSSPPDPTPAPSGGGSTSSTGTDNGSAAANAVMGIGLLVGSVAAGIGILLLV